MWPAAIFTMDQRKEHRVCIKFCANLGKSATETLTMIQQAFRDQSLSCAQVFQWQARFKTGRTSVDDDEHTGRTTSWKLLKLLHEFKSLSVRIDVKPFTTLLRWELVMGHANRFWRKNWVCTMSQPNMCPGSWQLTRSNSSASTSAFNWTEKQNGCHPPPTVLPWFGSACLLPISKNETEVERTPVLYHWGDTGRITESAWHSDRKGLPGSIPKMEETVGPVSTCGRELLRG